MNEKLKFSWFNIMTFVALIAIGYTSFVGLTYMTAGNFVIGGIGTAIILLVLLIYFMVMQTLKTATVYLRRKLRWEAVMLILSPVVFAILIIPSTHFFTVTARDSEIVAGFRQSISGAHQLFADYDTYSANRLQSLHDALTAAAANADPRLKLKSGREKMQMTNIERVLRGQLLSNDYKKLRSDAETWIGKADQGASTYNVFLLGNTRQIRKSIEQWQENLREISSHQMNAEKQLGLNVEFKSSGADTAIKGIDAINSAFVRRKFPNGVAILFCCITYLLLLLPYIFQSRNARNPYRLTDLFSSADKGDFSAGIDEPDERESRSDSGDDYSDDMGGFTLD